ncbi:tyrosinase family protein [Yinghuangia soli]|uniref:Tyrosinase family protein n=1 Tax=Yinghuangia soli TaxID=2908204 RepID=A0AA41U5V3_9ACTN|nr:tyrosinase family protein [Yinghuangia soli]MCF2530354.1 tyrosinase family protein [Yinghuangia soli]
MPVLPVKQRREVRALSAAEWAAYVAAVKAVHSGAAPTAYDRLAAVKLEFREEAHGTPKFLPWNRAYLVDFERRLQAVDPAVTVPYWNWCHDAQKFDQSVVLGPQYFGRVGLGPVTTGAFANWTVATTTSHVLMRRAGGTGTVPSVEVLNSALMKAYNYRTLCSSLEGSFNSRLHNAVGGDMASMTAANDPVFWSHAAFMDYAWSLWQRLNPTLANTSAGLDDHVLKPFGVTVRSMYSTAGLGYAYETWNPQV